MNKRSLLRRIAAFLFAAAMLTAAAAPVFAEQEAVPAAEEQPAENAAEPAGDAEETAPVEATAIVTTEATTATEPTTPRVTATAPDPLSMTQFEETEDGGICILAFRWTMEQNVEIPAAINGKPVTEIGEGAFKYCYADTVTLPDTVTEIGANAFEGCVYLRSAEIPDGCVRIGARAFADCERLSEVTIPDSVSEIGYLAFSGTAFEQAQKDDFVLLGDGILYAYRGSESDLEIPDTVKVIGAYACADHLAMKSVTIPESVRAIQKGAFAGCTALQDIRVPDYIAAVAPDAFSDTKWDTSSKGDFLTLGKMLLAYRGRDNEITVPDGIRVINDAAFAENSAVTVVHLPDSVEKIRAGAFQSCASLQVAEFGDGLKAIGTEAFLDCGTLSYLRLGHALETVGDYAFAGCPALTEIYLPDTVQHVGKKAFGYTKNGDASVRKLNNELTLYSNTEAVRLYAETEDLTRKPLPDEENTEPAPIVTAAPDAQQILGKPHGKAGLAAAALGGILVAAGLIRLIVTRRRMRD